MNNLVLVDSSIWLSALRGEATAIIKTKLDQLIEDNLVVIIPIIINELLQGTKTKKDYLELKNQLMSLNVEELKLANSDWQVIHESLLNFLRTVLEHLSQISLLLTIQSPTITFYFTTINILI